MLKVTKSRSVCPCWTQLPESGLGEGVWGAWVTTRDSLKEKPASQFCAVNASSRSPPSGFYFVPLCTGQSIWRQSLAICLYCRMYWKVIKLGVELGFFPLTGFVQLCSFAWPLWVLAACTFSGCVERGCLWRQCMGIAYSSAFSRCRAQAPGSWAAAEGLPTDKLFLK